MMLLVSEKRMVFDSNLKKGFVKVSLRSLARSLQQEQRILKVSKIAGGILRRTSRTLPEAAGQFCYHIEDKEKFD